MSKITNDGLTRSGTGCFIAVPMWQHWARQRVKLLANVVKFTDYSLPEVAARVNKPAASCRAGSGRRSSQLLADERVLAAEQFHRQSIVGRLRE